MSDPNALTEEDIAIMEAEQNGGELPDDVVIPPVEEPPVDDPPAEKLPAADPKVEDPPAEDPPAEDKLEDLDVKEGDSLEVINTKLNKALRYERAQGKDLKGTLEEQSRRLDGLDDLKEQIIALREARKAPPVEEETIPDEEEDPLGHAQGKLKKQGEDIKATNERLDLQEQHTEQMNFASEITALEATFRETTPDYNDAMAFLIDKRTSELKILGVTDAQAVQQDIVTNLQQITIAAVRNKKNPPQVVYDLATQYGYTKKAAADPDKSGQAAKDLADIAKGQDIASKNLNSGGEGDKAKSLESLMELEGDEFDKEWAKKFGSKP